MTSSWPTSAEHELSLIHPEVEPWWHRIFTEVSKRPPSRGRGVALARFVPRRTPWLGRRVWNSVDLTYKQALAPHFLQAWEEVLAGDDRSQPSVAELLADNSSGSPPGGPK